MTLTAGAIAYASGSQTLLACVSGQWTQVPLPQGPPGPKGATGDTGAPGPKGATGATGATGVAGSQIQLTPEPPGANCTSGGERIDVGVASNEGFVVEQMAYVCVEQMAYVCNGAPGGDDAGVPNGGPSLVSLSPQSQTVGPGDLATFTIRLAAPTPTDVTITLSLTPTSAAMEPALFPAAVTVLSGQQSATFAFTASTPATDATLTATLGASSLTASITPAVAGASHLVLNEIDYDQPGTDTAEFIEIYNPTATTQDLTDVAVVLVSGAFGTEYARFALDGSLASGAYLVLGNANVDVPPGVRKLAVFANDTIQNGAPDGVALISVTGHSVIDALSYEGSITVANIFGFPPVSLVEGVATSVADSPVVNGSLVRLPNGIDTDDAATDWAFSTTPTPGAPNSP